MNSQDVILGTLMNRSLSGYEIKQRFEDTFSYFYSSSYGTIYPMLHRMEQNGLITKESVLQEGKPNKNVYTITEAGISQFHTYLDSPLETENMKSDFLMRLFFGEIAGNVKVISWLKQEQKRAQLNLDKLLAKYEAYQSKMPPSSRICIEIGIKEYSAKLEVIQEGLARFEQLELEKRGYNDRSSFK